ncbi:MAG TPA: hypothetical protein VFF79_01440 [Conexibacter sp.]|jgi:hypothetical protein|nr:hypothetical protein [Conexibacter sp.]
MRSTPDISFLLPDDVAVRARRDALVDVVQPARPPRRRQRRTRRIAIAIASLFVLSCGAAVAAHVFSAGDVAVDAGIGCYDRASLDTNVSVIGPTADPVAACAKLWREGAMTAGRRSTAPQLVACTGERQPVRVFPAADAAVCRRLGLVPLPADYAPAGAASGRAHAALAKLSTLPTATTDCPSPQALADGARARLAAVGRDVRVVIAGSGPCAGGYDVANDHVVVTTVSRREARENRVVTRVEQALRAVFADARPGCRSPRQLADAARRALAGAGLRDVTVKLDGRGRCVTPGFGVDPANRVVTISTGAAP